MSNKKHTPLRKLFEMLWDCDRDKFVWWFHFKKMEWEFKKAIEQAYTQGEFDCGSNGTAEDYYKKIYGSIKETPDKTNT